MALAGHTAPHFPLASSVQNFKQEPRVMRQEINKIKLADDAERVKIRQLLEAKCLSGERLFSDGHRKSADLISLYTE